MATSILARLLFACAVALWPGAAHSAAPTEASATEAVPAFAASLDGAAPVRDGVRRRLDERDVLLDRNGALREWRAVEYTIANRHGLDTHGRYALGVAPLRERVQVHRIDVRRDGAVSDRLAATRQDLLAESDDPADTLSGRHRLTLLIPDLMVGDTVRIAWTRQRYPDDNPLPAELSVALDAPAPIARRLTRIRTSLDRAFVVRGVTDALGPSSGLWSDVSIGEAQGPTHRLFSIDQIDVPQRGAQPERLVISEAQDWADVATRLAPWYEPVAPAATEVSEVAALIRAGHSTPDGRAAAALQWVQQRIRYHAVQIGEGAWRPAPVERTLARGYGDCKAVTLLLSSLLQALGIESTAALTALDGSLASEDMPWRSHAFDHVLVRALIDGRPVWLDGTRAYQQGGLDAMSMPDHGRALTLDDGQLISMATPAPALPDIDSLTRLSQQSDGWQMQVRTERRRQAAERLRAERDRWPDEAIASARRESLAVRHGAPIESLADMQLLDETTGVVSLEHYRLPAATATSTLIDPVRIRRQLSAWLSHEPRPIVQLPLDLRERVVLAGPADELAIGETSLRNRWFTLHRRVVREADRQVVVDHRLIVARSVLDPSIEPLFLAAVHEALDALDATASPTQERAPGLGAATAVAPGPELARLLPLLAVLMLVTLAFVLAGWPRRLRRPGSA